MLIGQSLPGFACASGVDAKQKSTSDLWFKGASDDDVSALDQLLSHEDTTTVAEGGRGDDRLNRMKAVHPVLLRLHTGTGKCTASGDDQSTVRIHM